MTQYVAIHKAVHETLLLNKIQTSLLCALNSMLATMKQPPSLSVLRTQFLHGQWPLRLDAFFFNVSVRGMMGRMEYSAADMVFPIVCGFIDQLTRYIKSVTMTTIHEMYSSFISRVMTNDWRSKWDRKESKVIGAKL